VRLQDLSYVLFVVGNGKGARVNGEVPCGSEGFLYGVKGGERGGGRGMGGGGREAQ